MKRPTQWKDVFELPIEPPDELERGLLAVGALIESSLALHRNRSVQGCLISRLNGNRADILGEARELLATAGQRVDIIHAAGSSVGEEAARLFGGEYAFGAAKEVPVRLVTLPYLLEAEELARAERACGHWSMEVRLACVPPLQALVVDDRVVLSEFGDRRVTLIRVPEIVHAIGILFESVWSNAVPAMNRSIIFDCPHRSVLARRILSALHAGVPDEVAARELKVSVRTYGRYVAEIMWALGASSRFQAGVRAAKAGLLVPTSVTAPRDARFRGPLDDRDAWGSTWSGSAGRAGSPARRAAMPAGGAWATGGYECAACHGRTPVTAGTIFDRTRTPLTVWFTACWLFATQKDGIPGAAPAAIAGDRRLPDGVGDAGPGPLSGTVEADETYIGGEEAGLAGGRARARRS